MNLVFPALAIFVFILPGVLYRWSYNQGEGSYPLGRLGPISEQIPRAIVYAAGLNAAWACLVSLLTRRWPETVPPIDLAAVAAWVTNNFGEGDGRYGRLVRAPTDHPIHVFLYFLGLYAFSSCIGSAFRTTVRGLKLDLKWKSFRFDNDWHYLFKGEVLSFADPDYNLGTRERLDPDGRRGTIITAVVDFKDRSSLFMGILVDFFFDSSGNLERLLLEGVKRRDLLKDGDLDETDERARDGRWYEVRGHYFVLRMSELKTINIDYIINDDLRQAQALAAEASDEADERESRGIGG